MMNRFNPGWRVIYTRPQHEKRVQADLAERNIRTFLPCVKTLRTWNDRKKYISMPLFPSYIFVYLESNMDYYTALEIQSALYFLKSGKEVALVRDEVIDQISMLLGISEDIEVLEGRFSGGQKLLILEGAFSGQYCEFVEYNGSLKAIVRVDIMQRCMLVTLPKDHVALPAENFEYA